MIDEKKLDELFDEWRNGKHAEDRDVFDLDEMADIIRLAKLGLWAEKHGRYGLVMIGTHCVNNKNVDGDEILKLADEALAALPKDPSAPANPQQ